MRRTISIVGLLLVFAMLGALVWVTNQLPRMVAPLRAKPAKSQLQAVGSPSSTAAEGLLAGYGDPATPPIEDLRKIQRVATGYFSVVKDPARFPIGGNADFSAALRGENPNREVFVRPENPIFNAQGLLLDRWGTPLVVHPEAWRELELRSAGPDRIPYNQDDLILAPSGKTSESR